MKSFFKKIVVCILTVEARLVLRKYKPKIIAVTGNVGKTATKDAVASVLEGQFFIRASEKSFNSEIGVPLAILGCPNGWYSFFSWGAVFVEGLALIFLKNHYPAWLVLEVGADRPGDIGRIARWLSPDVVVLTRIGEVPVHIEFFASRDELVEEKMNLVRALAGGGLLVANADDRDVCARGAKIGKTIITYGEAEKAAIKALHTEIFYDKNGAPEGVRCKVEYRGNVLPLGVRGTIGKHYASVALAALGVATSLGMGIMAALERLGDMPIPPGRMKILRGRNDSIIIDDSYNASPTAVESALRSFGELRVPGRKIAVLADMLELGKYASDEHRKMGAFAAHAAGVLITVGPRAEEACDAALEQGMKAEDVLHFDTAESAGAYLEAHIGKGDAVLVKGSQNMRMERTVAAILCNPGEAKGLLVRQEEVWQKI